MGFIVRNPIFFLNFYISFSTFLNTIIWCSSAVDFISPGESLSGKQTIASKNGNFQLGFYTPGTSHKFYLAIWYNNNITPNSNPNVVTVVWMANRDKPLLDATSELKLLANGNLALFGNSLDTPIWSSKSTSTPDNSTVAVLLDSGNLVLRNGSNSSVLIWQSFDHPTDTWLPGSSLGLNKLRGEIRRLTSWISLEDPSPGPYSFEINPNGADQQFYLWWNRSQQYWNSNNGELGSFDNNAHDIGFKMDKNMSYISFLAQNNSLASRIVLNHLGQIQHFIWTAKENKWRLIFAYPRDPCDVYSLCGVFSECNGGELPKCKCLTGFVPENEENWVVQNRTGGCLRKAALRCENDRFRLQTGVKQLPNHSISLRSLSEDQCSQTCKSECNCVAYAFSNECLMWIGGLWNLQFDNRSPRNMFIRLAASDFWDFGVETENKKPKLSKKAKRQLKIIGGVNGSIIILLLSIFVVYLWTKKRREQGNTTLKEFQRGNKKVHKLSFYSFDAIAIATNNFSAASKLGEGGFGPVYKGKLPNEDEIAVKRLSNSSIQGLEEFKNEITLISELQHVNLVRLLGCCIEGEEKILIYEYMPNKSLDSFLFDPIKKASVNWEQRVHIIDGIAQGILYLHKYSRLKIIHRDLKASNILLDGDLNPKISDFGMARIHGGNQSKINTDRVAGTYGYMAPEYAAEGIFSVKSDVFSFGVLLLEIISGRQNTSFYHNDHCLTLTGYAWKLWKAGSALELLDSAYGNDPLSPRSQLTRYIHVALLCVQECASDRPIMSQVVYMLSNETATLSVPKQPAFFITTSINVTRCKTPSHPRTYSANDVTISDLEGR